MKSNTKIIQKYWKLFNNAEYEEAEKLLDEKCKVIWPNTREIFRKDKFIQANIEYPGKWYINLEETIERENGVITIAEVYTKNREQSYYVVSFFKIHHEKIIEIKEYWGENAPPPKWRIDKGYSSIY